MWAHVSLHKSSARRYKALIHPMNCLTRHSLRSVSFCHRLMFDVTLTWPELQIIVVDIVVTTDFVSGCYSLTIQFS